MRQSLLLLATAFLCFASLASAGPVEYIVSVNTSSIAGTVGSFDFNFNPGPLVTQAATLQIVNFASNGTLAGAPAIIGDVNGGPLPASLTFNNDTVFNDYFEGFTYGTTLSFDVILSGPALSTPNGTATSGSAFAFSMYSDAAGTIPTLTTDTTNGFAFTVDVNLDGTTTLTNSSTEATVMLPEPGTFGLMAFMAALGYAVHYLWHLKVRSGQKV